MTGEIRRFEIAVGDEVLEDLRARLERTRWPDRELVDDWSQGIPLAYLRDVCDTWLHDYDWRERETRLNRFDQYVTEIDGVDIHFVHQRSPHPDATPLLITHGWPGSFVEFDFVIEPLTDPTAHGGDAADAFHVVAPSLPGFAFSGKPTEPGWGVEKIAEVFAELMARLGYDHYLAQGGDWGSAVTAAIGAQDAGHCDGIHVTLAMSARPSGPPETDAARRAVEKYRYYVEWESGYSTQQRTRPQTLGYALADSPVGQAAWILEKFRSWTDDELTVGSTIDRPHLLDNVMLYWCNNAATSSARIYWESFGRASRQVVTIPSAFAVYPDEIIPPVREWVAELFTDIVHWSEQPRGGHFAAFEVPDLFVADLRNWKRALATR